jgi:hypothetical protein
MTADPPLEHSGSGVCGGDEEGRSGGGGEGQRAVRAVGAVRQRVRKRHALHAGAQGVEGEAQQRQGHAGALCPRDRQAEFCLGAPDEDPLGLVLLSTWPHGKLSSIRRKSRCSRSPLTPLLCPLYACAGTQVQMRVTNNGSVGVCYLRLEVEGMKRSLRWWPKWLNESTYPNYLEPGQSFSAGAVIPMTQGESVGSSHHPPPHPCFNHHTPLHCHHPFTRPWPVSRTTPPSRQAIPMRRSVTWRRVSRGTCPSRTRRTPRRRTGRTRCVAVWKTKNVVSMDYSTKMNDPYLTMMMEMMMTVMMMMTMMMMMMMI